MTAARCTLVAIALLVAAVATGGCGLGAGEQVGTVTLSVTRDYGADTLHSKSDEASESDTVMRVLERNADISTRYGGGFVQSIDGISGEESAGRSLDWFFYVNGVESTVGAADYDLHGGEAIWWDYRDWSAAMRVPAVVGSWPQPFTGGYEGKTRSVVVECMGGGDACAEVRQRLEGAGVRVSPAAVSSEGRGSEGSGSGDSGSDETGSEGSDEDAVRVLVGPWAQVSEDPAAGQIDGGPEESGVFADFESNGSGAGMVGLGEDGEPARKFAPQAGLVAATRRYEAPPVWVVTGATRAGVDAAARSLDEAHLRDRYAVAVEGDETIPLPLR
jgi:Domain of unknown function (DUF4430)